MGWSSVGAWLAALAVMAGAFGAHGLEGHVTSARLETFRTAADYQLWHAMALVLTGLLARQRVGSRALAWAGRGFLVGIVLFSGSLYALVLTDTPMLGMVTPLGGLSLISAWGLLGVGAWRR